MIKRALRQVLQSRIQGSNKVLILYGARQVGKTTLAMSLLEELSAKVLKINADQQEYLEVLSSRSLIQLRGLVEGYDWLFIDEAQRIPDIGINLKILHDQLPELRILVTGSSSLDLANRIKEPLTGRTWTYRLYPISATEWQANQQLNPLHLKQQLDPLLRFGLYPEVLNDGNFADKRAYLEELTSAYLYKDILALGNLRYPEKLRQLLKLLAYQIGNLVSIQELANTLGVNRDTVIHYLDLLEKAFIIFKLGGFSRNLRKEVVKMSKIYFHDLGVRNALIENFNPLSERTDIGALWENFLIAERLKEIEYRRLYGNRYFWRLHSGAELDYVEERDGMLEGYEFKWRKGNARAPESWTGTYSEASYTLVNQDNFLSFLTR
jgi:uncharacterized protein